MQISLSDLKELLSLGSNSNPDGSSPFIGQYVIIRGYASGVHFGQLISKNQRNVVLAESRRIHYCGVLKEDGKVVDGACSGLALHGVSEDSRVCGSVNIEITDALEIIKASEKSITSIKGAPVWYSK